VQYKSRHKGREGLKSSVCRMFMSTMHNGHRLMVYRTGTAAVKLLQKKIRSSLALRFDVPRKAEANAEWHCTMETMCRGRVGLSSSQPQ